MTCLPLPLCPVPCRPSFAPPKQLKTYDFANGPATCTSTLGNTPLPQWSVICDLSEIVPCHLDISGSSDSVPIQFLVSEFPKLISDFRNRPIASFQNYSASDAKHRLNFALFDARKIHGRVGEMCGSLFRVQPKPLLCFWRVVSLMSSRSVLRMKEWYTRCSAIAERPRCRVRYSFRQK